MSRTRPASPSLALHKARQEKARLSLIYNDLMGTYSLLPCRGGLDIIEAQEKKNPVIPRQWRYRLGACVYRVKCRVWSTSIIIRGLIALGGSGEIATIGSQSSRGVGA